MNALCGLGEFSINSALTFHFRLLGGASLERADGTLLVGRAAQRHRIALLTLLACSPGSGLSRDKLIALLWPESGTERARNLLNVSVYELRKALGDDAILSVGDELRLNGEVVASDIAEFTSALEREDHAAAVALYRGPFLDGFFVDDAPELERWTERERTRLADVYGHALEALAGSARLRRDFRGAAEWWGRRAAHDPYDSRVALELMQALDAAGHRAGALQHASIHERLLQQELGMPAAPAVRALAERMRAEPVAGPKLAAPAVAAPAAVAPAFVTAPLGTPETVPAADEPFHSHDAASAPQPTPAPQPASASPTPSKASSRSRRPLRVTSLALIAAVIVGIAVVVGLVWTLRTVAPVPERSVAVLPFVNMSPRGDDEYFSAGITEEIITQLSAVPTLKVISRTSAMRYKGSTKSLRQIATELGVAHVLEGSVRREGDKVRITAQLIDAGTDHHLWSRSYDRNLVDMFAVQDEIAREVAGALEARLGGARTVLARRRAPDPEAHELYTRGRYLWSKRTKEAHEQAMQYYQRAIARDSGYAEPYAGLAAADLTAYQFNLSSLPEAEVYSRIKWAAERALALDDQSTEAHTSFAVALWWQRDWPGAERELRRAIELNPGNATAHGWYGLLLGGMGRVNEAVTQSDRATALDPFAVTILYNSALMHFLARDDDGAIGLYKKSLEVNDAWAPSYAALALVYAHKGMDAEATRAASKAVELGGRQLSWFLANLAYVHARGGRRAEAEQVLRRAKADPREGFTIARVYVALGERDSAFAWLDRSDWQWPHRAALADPVLDPVRSDPRFVQLSARVAHEMGIR